MESACYIIFTKRKRNDPKVMVSQLFHHFIWPDGSSPTELIASIEERLSKYPKATNKPLTSIKNLCQRPCEASTSYLICS